MEIVMIPNASKPEALDCCQEAREILTGLGCQVAVKSRLFDANGRFQPEEDEGLSSCDLFIAVGGDGTIIHSAKLAARFGKPILGINAGTLGFTAGLEREGLPLLSCLLRGEYREERRLMLQADLVTENGETRFLALNDAVVSGETAAIVNYEMALGENRGYRYRADGFIVATPTGSTAYSLSAGGPVIQPDMDCLVYTPVCSHSLFGRSVVFGGDTQLVVTIPENTSRTFFTVDGEPPVEIFPGDRLVFSRAEAFATFIRLGNKDFYDVLNQKIVAAT